MKSKNTDNIGYTKLIIWQKTDQLAYLVYKLTNTFPKSEIYGITAQIRRSVLSVQTNIVEGYARNNKNEFRRFVLISSGSLAETKYLLDFSFRLNYLQNKEFHDLIEVIDECGKILWKFYKSI